MKMKSILNEWRKRLSEQTKELKIANAKELIAALENYGRSKGGFASDAARKAFIRTIVGSLRDEAKKGSPVFPIFSRKLNQMIQTVEEVFGADKLYKSVSAGRIAAKGSAKAKSETRYNWKGLLLNYAAAGGENLEKFLKSEMAANAVSASRLDVLALINKFKSLNMKARIKYANTLCGGNCRT